MRDPNRIYKYCNKLAEIWSQLPDWRLGQLMVNFLGTKTSSLGFFLEDEDFMSMLESYVKEIKVENN